MTEAENNQGRTAAAAGDDALDDPNLPEWTEEDNARAVPVSQLPDDLLDALVLNTATLEPRVRLDADVLSHFRALGPGWEVRVNAALRGVIDAIG